MITSSLAAIVPSVEVLKNSAETGSNATDKVCYFSLELSVSLRATATQSDLATRALFAIHAFQTIARSLPGKCVLERSNGTSNPA